MNITPINQSRSGNNLLLPTFQAKMKTPTNTQLLINQLSNDFINSNIGLSDTFNLSKIINDPKKNKVFLATLASLLTATAAKIADIITGEEESKKISPDGDCIEISSKKTRKKKETTSQAIKFIKHSGTKAKQEKELEAIILDLTSKFKLQIEQQEELIKLYNNFCGLNHKKTSFNNTNEEIVNSEISKKLVEQLNTSSNISDIDKIIQEYKIYSPERKNLPDIPETQKEAVITEQINVPSVITSRNNIKAKYITLDKENRDKLDEFFDILKETHPKISRGVLHEINSKFPDLIPQILNIYKGLPEDYSTNLKENYLTQIANSMIVKEAIENWGNNNKIKPLNFLEYNSLLSNNVDEKSIEELASMKKQLDISEINIAYYDKKILLKAPKVFLNDSFKTILKVFQIIHPNTETLNSECKEYNITDIKNEVADNQNSYTHMVSYLSEKGGKYFNKGKMASLLEIYNKANINKDLFTLHSYMRFLERYVLPELDKDKSKYISTKQIERKYIEQLMALKTALTETLKETIAISEYSIEEANIKAPKILVPLKGNNEQWYEITINNQGKIHTIF